MLGHVSRDDLVDMFRVAIATDTSNVSIMLKPSAPTESPRRAAHRARRGGPHPAQRAVPLGRSGDDREHPTGEGDVAIVPGRRGRGRRTSERAVGCTVSRVITSCRSPRRIRPIARPRPPPEETEPPPWNRPSSAPPVADVTPPITEGSTPPAPDQDVRGMVEGEFLVGPLPVHSAGPLGGILTDSDPLPTLDRIDAALVDFPRVDSLLPGMIRGRGGWGGGRGAGRSREDSASVVVLEGPGGFPVLAAASLASRPPLTDAAAVACLPELLESIGQASTTAAMASRTVESREGNRPTRRSSIALALHVAALMATGLLLPDFITVLGDREADVGLASPWEHAGGETTGRDTESSRSLAWGPCRTSPARCSGPSLRARRTSGCGASGCR